MSSREAAFRRLFHANYRPLLAYAVRRTTQRSDAEDAVAEAFVVAWRRIDEVPTDDREQRLWLYAVARRTLANHRRGSKRAERLPQRLIPLTGNSPSADMNIEDEADVQLGLWALGQLSEEDQELVRLALWEELTHAEIAQLIGTPVPNVAVRLHRARERLRQIFNGRMQGPAAGGHSTVTRAIGSHRHQESTE
ncbi:MAG: sigma-70 family RNA polymerase sigma factor [Acidimicrobiia bacterium]